MNNEMAVSPIVATLVLIVVAVIGAVAVGTIMGTFSTSVSKNVNANQANAASQNEILIAGSTTVDPINQLAGKIYSETNPGVKIVSQAIGSGAGVQAVGSGVADIGATSDPVSAAWSAQFPNLQYNLIGYGAIAVITNYAHPANTAANVTYADLQNVFNSKTFTPASLTTVTPGVTTVIRSDNSGTATVWYQFLGQTKQQYVGANTNTTAVNGNLAVVQTVGSTAYALGFADYGDSMNAAQGSSPTISFVPFGDGNFADPAFQATQTQLAYSLPKAPSNPSNVYYDWNQIRLNGARPLYQNTVETPSATFNQTNAMAWNLSLIRPLTYITNGQPSSDVANYINFVKSGPIDHNTVGNPGVFQEVNDYGLPDLA
jgi:phosphate transport system substrate-binding protein